MRLQAQRAKGSLTATRLYLVRHGRVAEGHTDRYHGHNDIGLSPQGVRQFEDLAAQLAATPLAGVYSSDLTRAITGAEIISRGRDLKPQIIPEFREVNFGSWEGLTFAEIMAQYPAELEERFRDLPNFRIPGGESLKDVRDRALPKLQELLARHANESFLLVAHTGLLRYEVALGPEEIQKVRKAGGFEERLGAHALEGVPEPDAKKLRSLHAV